MLTPEQILEDIRAKLDHPATVRELMQKLGLPREQRVGLRRGLATLVGAGALIKVRGNRYGLPARMRLVTGRAHVHPRGFGFVKPEHPVDGLAGDLYIAASSRASRAARRPTGPRDGSSAFSSGSPSVSSAATTSTRQGSPTCSRSTGG